MHPPGGYVIRISVPPKTVCLLAHKASGVTFAMFGRIGRLSGGVSSTAFSALLLSLVLALSLALLGFLRGPLALRFLVLALRLGCLLLALGRPLLGLLSLPLRCRAALLRRRLAARGLLRVPASRCLRFHARRRRSGLLTHRRGGLLG